MLNVEKLNAEREKAFCVWFERWYKKKNIEKEIEIANNEGYTGYKISLSNETERDAFQIRQEMFIPLLKEKLTGFTVKKTTKRYKNFLFPGLGDVEKDFIVIRWGN